LHRFILQKAVQLTLLGLGLLLGPRLLLSLGLLFGILLLLVLLVLYDGLVLSPQLRQRRNRRQNLFFLLPDDDGGKLELTDLDLLVVLHVNIANHGQLGVAHDVQQLGIADHEGVHIDEETLAVTLARELDETELGMVKVHGCLLVDVGFVGLSSGRLVA
ncbi:hypothetical protein FN846DRAFT_985948, partial [Sphaerosporella brunnea]